MGSTGYIQRNSVFLLNICSRCHLVRQFSWLPAIVKRKYKSILLHASVEVRSDTPQVVSETVIKQCGWPDDSTGYRQ
jgi:hypothetical protein